MSEKSDMPTQQVPGVPLRATLVGLGRINLGLMGPAFRAAGFEVSGVNFRYPEMVRALEDKKAYVILERLMNQTEQVRRQLLVNLSHAYLYRVDDPNSDGNQQAVVTAAKSHVIVSGVGPEAAAQEKIASFLLQVLQERVQNDGDMHGPLDICGCENPTGLSFSTAILRNRLLGKVVDIGDERRRVRILQHMRHHVRFPLLLVDRVCSQRYIDPESGFVTVVAEPYASIRCSDNAQNLKYLAQGNSAATFTLASDMESYRLLKLNLLNCAHALAAYCGHFHGCKTIDEAVAKPEVRHLIERALDQVANSLKLRGGLPEHEIDGFRAGILIRLENVLDDAVPRVARDPLRKLKRDDRLLGSALLVLYNSFQVSEELAQGIAAGFVYALEYPEDDSMQIEQGEPDADALSLKARLLSRGSGAEQVVTAMEEVLCHDCGLKTEPDTSTGGAASLERLLLERITFHFTRFISHRRGTS